MQSAAADSEIDPNSIQKMLSLRINTINTVYYYCIE